MPPSTGLINRLRVHEGAQRYAYQDTKGFWTIGIGRNIDPRSGHGLSPAEQEYLLLNDLNEIHTALIPLSWFAGLDQVRQEVVMEMALNLGVNGFLQFKDMISDLAKHDYMSAATAAYQSEWATQIGKDRLMDIINRLKSGMYA